MIVLDASAAIDWLLQTSAGQRVEKRISSRNESLHAPHLLDLEVAQVLRRLVREGWLPLRRADEAIDDLVDLRVTRYPHCVTRYPHFVLLPRVWQLRHNFSRTMLHISRLQRNSELHSLPGTAGSHLPRAMRR